MVRFIRKNCGIPFLTGFVEQPVRNGCRGCGIVTAFYQASFLVVSAIEILLIIDSVLHTKCFEILTGFYSLFHGFRLDLQFVHNLSDIFFRSILRDISSEREASVIYLIIIIFVGFVIFLYFFIAGLIDFRQVFKISGGKHIFLCKRPDSFFRGILTVQ